MFTIGSSEVIASAPSGLLRHHIVWLGDSCGETARGMPATHPICRVLLTVLERANFLATWLVCHDVSRMREFERKATLLKLKKAKWTLEVDSSELIRAHSTVSPESPWPYTSEPAMPWPQEEILIVGTSFDWNPVDCHLDCRNESSWRHLHSVQGDALLLHSRIPELLLSKQCYAISVGRTHTENTPGLSIVAPDGALDPETLVSSSEVVAVHRGADAERAWAYGRIAAKT
jgi:hypothetical protein